MTVIEYERGAEGRFVAELLRAKDALERTREQIIRHCTMTSATLIGLLAVFGDSGERDIVLRLLGMTSVVFLSLSVVLGVVYSFLYIRTGISSLERALTLYQEGGGVDYGSPCRAIVTVGRLFPWVTASGVLLLSAGVLYALWCR